MNMTKFVNLREESKKVKWIDWGIKKEDVLKRYPNAEYANTILMGSQAYNEFNLPDGWTLYAKSKGK